LRIGPSLAYAWLEGLRGLCKALSDLEGLEVKDRVGLLMDIEDLAVRLSRLIKEAFLKKAREALPYLSSLSSALEGLHEGLLAPQGPEPGASTGQEGPTAWSLFLYLASQVLKEVGEVLKALTGPGEAALDKLAALAEELRGLRGLLDYISVVGPSSPAHGLAKAVRSLLPGRMGLASLLVLPSLARGAKGDRRSWPSLLAKLLEKGLEDRCIGLRGCLGLGEAASWASRVLGLEVSVDEVESALGVLVDRGLLKGLDEERGLAILRPREEDIDAAFRWAKQRYRHLGRGLSERSFTEALGWCPEYSSAVVEEMANRGLLMRNSDTWLPVSEEQAWSLLTEAESCFEAELIKEASRLYELASSLFTKLSERAEGEKLELLLAEASYCDFMKAYCNALTLFDELRSAAIRGLELDVSELEKLKYLVRTATKCYNETLKRLNKLLSTGGPGVAKEVSEVLELLEKKAEGFRAFRGEVLALS